MIRPGTRVARLGVRGLGGVIRVKDGRCLIRWAGGKKEEHLETELAWVGLTIHTLDGRAGTIVELSRRTADIRVRLMAGVSCWLNPDEIAPRQPKQQDVAAELNMNN
jgi:hypothetical protein